MILGAGPAHAAHFGMYEFIREISGGREDGWWGVGGTGESELRGLGQFGLILTFQRWQEQLPRSLRTLS